MSELTVRHLDPARFQQAQREAILRYNRAIAKEYGEEVLSRLQAGEERRAHAEATLRRDFALVGR